MQMRAGVAKKTIKSIRQQAFEQTHLFDSHPESSLDFEKVRAAVKDGYNRPFLLIDSNIVREKARRFVAAMPRVRPHYAVKANPDPRVLDIVLAEGGGFEIASISELDLLLAQGVPAAEGFYSNPVKSRDQIAQVCWYSGTPMRLPARSFGFFIPDLRLIAMKPIRNAIDGNTGMATNGHSRLTKRCTNSEEEYSARSNSSPPDMRSKIGRG